MPFNPSPEKRGEIMNYNLENYYYHTISKDDVKQTYEILEKVLNDGQLKTQQLLGKNEVKFNGMNYISLASYVENNEYKTFIVDENSFNDSKLANIFDNYNSYLDYMKLDSQLEIPLSKEEFFIKNNTNNKRNYYNYLDSITRTYPVDISYLYRKTNDEIYKYILEMIDNEILYCYPSGNCFDEYIKNTKGITFVFPKNIKIENVTIIPNLPFEIESKLVIKISNEVNRYSNLIGEVQVKDFIYIDNAIGIIVPDNLKLSKVSNILKKHNYNKKLFKLMDEKLVEIKGVDLNE